MAPSCDFSFFSLRGWVFKVDNFKEIWYVQLIILKMKIERLVATISIQWLQPFQHHSSKYLNVTWMPVWLLFSSMVTLSMKVKFSFLFTSSNSSSSSSNSSNMIWKIGKTASEYTEQTISRISLCWYDKDIYLSFSTSILCQPWEGGSPDRYPKRFNSKFEFRQNWIQFNIRFNIGFPKFNSNNYSIQK